MTLIKITVDEMDECCPTFCSPCVWIARIENQPGCGLNVDFYSEDEIRNRFNDFLAEIPLSIFRTVFEATECRLHDITEEEAIDAILLGFSRYFEEDDTPHIDASRFHINRDIDFKITTAWDGETERFTLLSTGEIKYFD